MKREETRGAHTKTRALGTRQAGPSQIAASLCGPDFPQCGLPLSLTLPLASKNPMQMRSGEQPGQCRQQHPRNSGLASAPAQGKRPPSQGQGIFPNTLGSGRPAVTSCSETDTAVYADGGCYMVPLYQKYPGPKCPLGEML